jgi:hypothetical protein
LFFNRGSPKLFTIFSLIGFHVDGFRNNCH